MHSQANICVCHQRKLCSAYSVYKDNKIAALNLCLECVYDLSGYFLIFKACLKIKITQSQHSYVAS